MKNLLLLMLILISCSKGAKTPEGLVKMYIEDITTKTLSRDYFEQYTTDDLYNKIETMNDDDFQKFASLKMVKNAKVEITNKSCISDEQCSLTYIVKYDYNGKDNKSFKSEVKKLAIVKQIEGNWKLSEVSNIKTYLDSQTPIEVLK